VLPAALLKIQMLFSQPAVSETSTRTGSAREGVRHFPKDWPSLFALTVIGAVLRCLYLTRKSFWFDEGVSVEIARLDWYNFARILWRREGNMSLYYVLLRGWLHFGHSEFFIRSLSILPSLATIPVVYWLAGRLFDRRVGLIAATLLTFNAYHIRYAQEARSYSFFIFLGTLSSAFFIDLLQQPTRRNRIGHILASSLAVYAHLYAVLLIVAQWLSLRFLKYEGIKIPLNTKQNWRWIAILVFPALLFVGTTGAGPISWIKRPGFKELYEYYEHMAGNGGILLVLVYFCACLAALTEVGGRLFQRRLSWDSWRYQFLLLWLIVPVVFTVLISIVRPMFLARYLAFCLPALIVLAAVGLARLSKSWLIISALLLVMALSLKGTFSYYDHDFDLDRDEWRAASFYILDHARPSDVILFHIAMGRMPYEFYKSVYTGNSPGPTVIYPTHGTRFDYRDFMGRPSNEFLRTVPSKYDRVWIVLKNNETKTGTDPTTALINGLFGESYPHFDKQNFPWIEVRLYSKQ